MGHHSIDPFNEGHGGVAVSLGVSLVKGVRGVLLVVEEHVVVDNCK